MGPLYPQDTVGQKVSYPSYHGNYQGFFLMTVRPGVTALTEHKNQSNFLMYVVKNAVFDVNSWTTGSCAVVPAGVAAALEPERTRRGRRKNHRRRRRR